MVQQGQQPQRLGGRRAGGPVQQAQHPTPMLQQQVGTISDPKQFLSAFLWSREWYRNILSLKHCYNLLKALL